MENGFLDVIAFLESESLCGMSMSQTLWRRQSWKRLYIVAKILHHVYLQTVVSPLSYTLYGNAPIQRSSWQILLCLINQPSRICKRRGIMFQISLLLFLTWSEYFYSQPTKYGLKNVPLLLKNLDHVIDLIFCEMKK